MSRLQIDRNNEFCSKLFVEYYNEMGARHQLTVLFSLQQNGVVERRNQTVVATTRSMMKAKGLPGYFWSEGITTVVYLLNRSPTRSVEGKTPYETWQDRKLSIADIHMFGCIVHVKNTKPLLKKVDDRSTKMVFMGYELGLRRIEPTIRRPGAEASC
jgi:hypothetical protein